MARERQLNDIDLLDFSNWTLRDANEARKKLSTSECKRLEFDLMQGDSLSQVDNVRLVLQLKSDIRRLESVIDILTAQKEKQDRRGKESA